MTSRSYIVLTLVLAVVSCFEFFPGLRPGWTFLEAMNYGGLVFLGAFLFIFLLERK